MDPVFSNRISIQWGQEDPYEDTDTWVLTASNGKFVDARIDLKTNTPQWLITGEEVELPTKEGYVFSLKFVHDLDSVHGDNSENSVDCGHFKSLSDGSRLEEGEMYNILEKKSMPYKEIWQSIDPVNSTPSKKSALVNDQCNGSSVSSVVWELSAADAKNNARGTFISIGNVSQGVVEYKGQFQCIRTWNNTVVYQYGSHVEEIFGRFMKGLSTHNDAFPWERRYP
ncbi:unnamed protein product [Kluyveromyces dobzhanskii CBS 2104]|uniref:Protein HRI1 n=1 Tax=Kluyveromyces dobzhanskii CBS 2104 TaxID=1427455 RepID=A0A0A8LAT3_9SACH|nr:unnamed protein product [Kluyveromyces dobzhanskii CBS 2104]